MGAVLVGLIVVAMVALPLVWAVRSDRRRDAADQVAASARAAVRQRLGGEAYVTVDVTAPDFTHHGRVVLSAPQGYDWMVERAWPAVASRVPAGYDVVVSRPDVVRTPSAPHAAPTLRRAA